MPAGFVLMSQTSDFRPTHASEKPKAMKSGNEKVWVYRIFSRSKQDLDGLVWSTLYHLKSPANI